MRRPPSVIERQHGAGRVPDDGFLLASVPYDEIGVDRARAELKALSGFAANRDYAGNFELASADDDAYRSARLERPADGLVGRLTKQ